MSYLTLHNGLPDFSQAVISLWFRAPSESVIAASDHRIDAGVDGFFLLQNILPLVTFGRQQTGRADTLPVHDVAVIHEYVPGEPDASTTYMTQYIQEGPSYQLDPSFIGLLCNGDGSFYLYFNFQTEDLSDLDQPDHLTIQMDLWSGADPAAPTPELGNGVVNLFPNVGVAAITSERHAFSPTPEFFTVTSDEAYDPDTWHHLLLSFDIGGAVSIGTPFASSSCRLWYAIDDVDYRGPDNMGPYRDPSGPWGSDEGHLDDNAILTRNAWQHSGVDPDLEAAQYYQNHFVGLPAGTYGGGAIPSAGAPMGIPASIQYQDGVFRCEMAEFQLFTGITLDTGIESNRRAFIVRRDGEEGVKLYPAKPGIAEEFMGKRPEVLLHRSADWKKGRNTGSMGKTAAGEFISDGQFVSTAKIEKYTPDPSISVGASAIRIRQKVKAA